jgi:hypothetical protein
VWFLTRAAEENSWKSNENISRWKLAEGHTEFFRSRKCKAVPQLRPLLACFLPRLPGFELRSGHVGFVMDKEALGQILSEHFGFSCQFSFHRLLHIHHHHHHHLSSGAGTIDRLVADVPSGLSLTPIPRHTLSRKCKFSYLRLEVIPLQNSDGGSEGLYRGGHYQESSSLK